MKLGAIYNKYGLCLTLSVSQGYTWNVFRHIQVVSRMQFLVSFSPEQFNEYLEYNMFTRILNACWRLYMPGEI